MSKNPMQHLKVYYFATKQLNGYKNEYAHKSWFVFENDSAYPNIHIHACKKKTTQSITSLLYGKHVL